MNPIVGPLAKTDVIVCLQAGDIHLSKYTKLEIWAQHVDAIEYGSHTGWILPENLKENGAKGVLINHSEHSTKYISLIVKRCKEIGLKTMVLVPTPRHIKKVVHLKPDYVGIEPPELIGSKTESIANYPKLISKSVINAKGIPLFIGAGIKRKKDVETGRKLGAVGTLVASAVVKAKDPKKVVKSLQFR